MASNTAFNLLKPGSLGTSLAPKVYVIHENEIWVEPLRAAFEARNIPYEEIFLHEGSINLNEVPPEGIYYNRMSASSHTRGHRYAVELTGPFIAWLEAHGRKVVNNRRALQLEVRKFEQYLALNQFGIPTPKTIAANSKADVLQAAKQLNLTPFIIKPNRGGKGLGVTLFNTLTELERWLQQTPELDTLDGVTLVQEYVKPKGGYIVRTEFIGGQFQYAVQVDASNGFELCPADTCQAGDAFCPVGETLPTEKPKFKLLQHYHNPDLDKYAAFLAANGIEIGAIEYAENEQGERVVYDVNINTNYNAAAEQAAGALGGMARIADFLGAELQKNYHSTVQPAFAATA